MNSYRDVQRPLVDRVLDEHFAPEPFAVEPFVVEPLVEPVAESVHASAIGAIGAIGSRKGFTKNVKKFVKALGGCNT